MTERVVAGRAYDPVTAIDESGATGETARIFADIRATMQIPLVTSIWRGLHSIEGSLPAAWAQTKPLYASGLPARCLHTIVTEAALPLPVGNSSIDWALAAGGARGLAAALTVIDAYNRSNGLNLVTLTALIVEPGPDQPEALDETQVSWPGLPPLRSREQIKDEVWALVTAVNGLGAAGVSDQVATLWRHLAHWPALLSKVCLALQPMHENGQLQAAANGMLVSTGAQARQLAHWRDSPLGLTPVASKTVRDYVTVPTQVARMVAIGHLIANAIRQQQRLAPC